MKNKRKHEPLLAETNSKQQKGQEEHYRNEYYSKVRNIQIHERKQNRRTTTTKGSLQTYMKFLGYVQPTKLMDLKSFHFITYLPHL